jgi:multidrug transporter EmrE-like cation transporter
VITGAVAWLAPPQTWDSLNYHMARVAHWAQNGLIAHFATGIRYKCISLGQKSSCHEYVLAQNDRLVNFVQWWAMVSPVQLRDCLQPGEWKIQNKTLGCCDYSYHPNGIIQASSTVNDYVLAYWVLATAIETFDIYTTRTIWPGLFFAGAAAGLALWTKPTAIAYLIPLGCIILFCMSRHFLQKRNQIKSFLPQLMASLTVILLINAGPWLRNYNTYGNLISDPIRQSTHQNELITPAGIASNFKVILPSMGSAWVKPKWFSNMIKFHDYKFQEDPRTTLLDHIQDIIRTNEESSGNTLHAFLIVRLHHLVFKESTLNLSNSGSGSNQHVDAAFQCNLQWIYGSRYLPFFVLFTYHRSCFGHSTFEDVIYWVLYFHRCDTLAFSIDSPHRSQIWS